MTRSIADMIFGGPLTYVIVERMMEEADLIGKLGHSSGVSVAEGISIARKLEPFRKSVLQVRRRQGHWN
ncbi:hypothetical protein [Caballeronia sp. DA-9]|uniref:hypothetical protein n=1 Tax=Caballeronia sp. DA-9 TaxID=3436237 RepID=UPI003F67A36D